MITLKGIYKAKRIISEILIEYIWNSPVESIIVKMGPRIPREVIPDMLHNIAKFFEL